jgi:hypothetical protein
MKYASVVDVNDEESVSIKYKVKSSSSCKQVLEHTGQPIKKHVLFFIIKNGRSCF